MLFNYGACKYGTNCYEKDWQEQNTTENCSQAARLLMKEDDKISSFAGNWSLEEDCVWLKRPEIRDFASHLIHTTPKLKTCFWKYW